MSSTRIIAALAVVVASTSLASPQASRKAGRITVGRDTTYLTAPLREDGTIDYLAAVNAAASKGVTADNNAAIPVLKAIGPELIDAEVREKTLAMLKVSPASLPGPHLRAIPRGADEWLEPVFKTAVEGPWAAKESPQVVRWLEANREPLDLMVKASKRSRWYVPRVADPEHPALSNTMMPNYGKVTDAGRALRIRANRAITQCRAEDAWRDILAMHRLGGVMGQEDLFLSHLVGIALGAMADRATVDLATSGALTAAQAKAILKDMASLPPGPDAVSAIERTERYPLLDIISRFAVDPVQAQRQLLDITGVSAQGEGDPAILPPDKARALFAGVDFDHILRRANRYFDVLAAAMRKPTYAQRLAAYKQISEALMRTKLLAAAPAKDKPTGGESGKTRRLGTFLLAMLLPTLDRARTLSDRQTMDRELARLAVALAAHKAEKGSYPPTLAALAPAYVQAVPNDFFSGKGFIYQRRGEGYLLYSVGDNALDDGGKPRPEGDDLVARAKR